MCDTEPGREGTSDKDSSKVDELTERKTDLEWTARYNILLNEDMERYYGLCDTFCKIVVALFGTYAFASLFINKSVVYSACGVLVTALSILMLVIDFKDKQVRARSQRSRYYEALSSVNSIKNDADADAVDVLLSKIAGDDLPAWPVCEALAVNNAIDQMGRDVTYKAEVGALKRMTRYIIPWGKPKYGHR